MSGKAVLREKFSDKCLHQEKRMISNKQPNLTPQRTRKRRKNKAQSQQKEKNNKLIKVRDEIGTKNFFNVNEAKS